MEVLAHVFDPPFRLSRPSGPLAPVIVNSPHSGAIYPQSFLQSARLDAHCLRRSEDAFVAELFAAAPALGAPLLEACFPRAFLDVNREPWELDPAMFDGALPPYANTSSIRVAAGLGTIARVVSENEEIYSRKLSLAEAEARILQLYFPYHAALGRLIDDMHAHFGSVLLLDCHSMPTSAAASGLSQTGQRPDVVLGDRHGSACSGIITAALESLLTAQGLKVARNLPYAGGFITQTHGKPRLGRHAIQIEICRSLYMDEATLAKTEGFEPLRAAMTVVMTGLFTSLAPLLVPATLAAE
jgi:N-formylglutamate amidohydrolase